MQRQILEAVIIKTYTDLQMPKEGGNAIYLESEEYLVRLKDKTHQIGYFGAEMTEPIKHKTLQESADKMVGKTFSDAFVKGCIKNNSIYFSCEAWQTNVEIDEIESIKPISEIMFNN